MTSSGPDSAEPGRQGLTVAKIAHLAGVSAPTVSRVLNGQPGVALGTRQRVEAVLREQGYQRRESGPAAILELVFHALESLWALEIIRGVEQVAREHGLAVVLTEMQGRLTPGRAWTEQVLARRPAGVIAVFSELTVQQQSQLATRSIPLVVLDPTGEPLHRTPSVGATNWSGGMAATRHLLDLGHRRIAMLSGPTEWPCCRARLDGYRAAMDAAGVPVDPDLVRVSTLYVEGGLRDGGELLRLPAPPTAIFTANDLQAFGVYEAARQAGLRIPEDLSVVGFDDLSFTRWAGPPMTTVRQPLVRMGAAAARMIVALAGGEELEQHRVELATELVVRQSTAPPSRR
ncbi:LacI family transcriptional regulator [Planomonospora parontospora subsp. parontospora]|uniref:LacI family transcriptional regulator n=2 Tax=Planomonospora parontospora TaxID=58119 RepID=A0AA37BDI7_9ACTN|nr:LacI family DNA-binding transcriptional regulator [Planomonospora parontospora]GGK52273.1 LacI family transcriptional regulator [Planomonospora parontospora]GII06891.1 LacI family transcriptional regulator [Planomonospora parontospora subsp. parontospora]